MKIHSFVTLCTLILISCSQKSQYFIPPIFLGVQNISHNTLTLHFDQDVTLKDVVITPDLAIENIEYHTIFFQHAQPAQAYTLQARAQSDRTSLQFSLIFWAIPILSPPPLVVNELSIIHNKTITDAIELRAMASGDIIGTTIYLGTPEQFHARYIFPSKRVQAGELIVLHADKQEGFFFPNSPRLSNTREVITIASNPYTIPYYALSYEKSSHPVSTNPSKQKRIFDENLSYIQRHALWSGNPIDSQYVTATRSLNRYPLSIQNPETHDNWYTTVTKGSSIGTINNSSIYQPKSAPK
ncbi:hypothetical protein PVA45_01960 [Entomospira entomophila]|uniref:TP-1001-like C-terminal domain-containing protein n=1 Tax=Entomospira entomophila TaxID=2719988 RepID=A0A968G820_9SPIO|nr:hypothetical protein [Entomospira entomophilus]NIZ40278.1 hypothetical protein [Entomospira entomophilus]WDI35837.1 hypothetical protein PVA45_01960 [Entomospira entomophilus]